MLAILALIRGDLSAPRSITETTPGREFRSQLGRGGIGNPGVANIISVIAFILRLP